MSRYLTIDGIEIAIRRLEQIAGLNEQSGQVGQQMCGPVVRQAEALDKFSAGLNCSQEGYLSDTRKGNVRYKGRDYGVTWHPISKVSVYRQRSVARDTLQHRRS